MGEVKQIIIKNRTYYFYNDLINFKDFQSSLLKIGEQHYKGINIYYIGYITISKIDDYEIIYSVNPWKQRNIKKIGICLERDNKQNQGNKWW